MILNYRMLITQISNKLHLGCYIMYVCLWADFDDVNTVFRSPNDTIVKVNQRKEPTCSKQQYIIVRLMICQ